MVQHQDAYGNTIPGYSGTVKLTSTDSAAAPLTGNYAFTTGAGQDNGTHTFTATLKKAGTELITATDTTNGTITSSENNIQVVPVTLVVSGFPSPTSAGFGEAFTVTADNPNGTVAAGYTGTIVLSTSDTSASFDGSFGLSWLK